MRISCFRWHPTVDNALAFPQNFLNPNMMRLLVSREWEKALPKVSIGRDQQYIAGDGNQCHAVSWHKF